MKKIINFSIIGMVILFGGLKASALYFNLLTDSLPRGIYKKISTGTVKIGDYVSSCLTKEIAQLGLEKGYLKPGFCSTGIMPVLKKVYALPNDKISFKDKVLCINGHETDFWVLPTDSKGIKVQFNLNEITIPEDQYFLLSDYNSKSWDSRYFGPVPINFVLTSFWGKDYAKER